MTAKEALELSLSNRVNSDNDLIKKSFENINFVYNKIKEATLLGSYIISINYLQKGTILKLKEDGYVVTQYSSWYNIYWGK